ncbi:hypothetical protein ACFGVR_06615 [Mucilaginibacter sp. AW1-3]
MKRMFITIIAVFIGMVTVNAQNVYQLSFKELPKDIQKYIGKNFGGYAVDKAMQEQDKDSKVSYTDVYVSKGQEKFKLVFDKKDKFVKKETLPAPAHHTDTTKKHAPAPHTDPAKKG